MSAISSAMHAVERAAPSVVRGVDDVSGGAVIDLAGGSIESLLGAGRGSVDELLPEFLQGQRWFANKDAQVASARIGDLVPIPGAGSERPVGHLAMLDVAYADGTAPERYATMLAALPAGSARLEANGVAPIATVHAKEGTFVLADAAVDRELVGGMVDAMRGNAELAGLDASLTGAGGTVLDRAGTTLANADVAPLSMHTSNTSMRVTGSDATDYAFKLVRRHDGILDPNAPTRALDVWKGAYLTNEAGFRNTPAVLGSIDHVGAEGLPRTVAVLTEFVPNDGDSWAHALDAARRAVTAAGSGVDGAAAASIDDYAVAARNHGRRLGELHVAFASGGASSEFRGVRMGRDAVEARLGRLQADADDVVEKLRRIGRDDVADIIAERVPARIEEVRRATDELVPIDAIHTHGDFHLGQMLRTADDVQIIDLEGAPALSLAERWQRTIALGDVARQRSSYEYAATQAVREAADVADPATSAALRETAEQWATRSKEEFLTGWLDATADRRFRHARVEITPELREAELANALYETSYELGSRPDWVDIPLARLRHLLDQAAG